jgi:diacylglycerol O-acyltransferase
MTAAPTATAATRGTTPPSRVHAEFMQIWEEGYVSNHISFENMHTPGLFVVAGDALRDSDGALDRERIRRYVDATMASHPAFRVRLQRSFLGLTPPAWVPDDRFDLDRHLVFWDEVLDFETADLRKLSGVDDVVMPLRHPLWRVRITELTNGAVTVGITMHHASMDGLSGMRLFSSTSQPSADAETGSPVDPFAGVRPARGWQLPILAIAQWWRGAGSPRAAWSAYRAKPFLRRVRRVAARLTLPLRYGRGGERAREQALPPRHSAYRKMDAGAAGRRARDLGATLSDLQVAAIIGAWDGEDRVVRLRFPVSFHSTAERGVRNHVRDMEVFGDADADFTKTIESVHRQVEERDDSKPYPPVPGRPIGYSTLLPWVSRPRYFCGAEILDMAPFPASLGRDDLAAAGIMYRGQLFIGANMPIDQDVEATTGRIYELMTGLPDTGRPSPA